MLLSQFIIPNKKMLIGGIQTLTLVDYPDKISCVIFTAGCNFRCGFCHNPQFVSPEEIKNLKGHFIPEDKFFSFLDSRKNFLDGVVISGGEPTIQPNLIDFIKKIKLYGLLVKLDSNGTNPELLETLIKEKLIDYVAMDIKASKAKYADICEVPINFENIKKSKNLIIKSKIKHNFRTTVLQKFHDEKEIEAIAIFCQDAQKYTIQNFRNKKTLNPKFHKYHGFTQDELENFKKIAEKYIKKVEVLG